MNNSRSHPVLRGRQACRILLAAMLALAAEPASAESPAAAPLAATAPLRKAVAAESIFRHLQTFQEIAERNGGHRAAGSPGYDRSAAYVADLLRAAGYEITIQGFDVPYFEETAAPVLAVEAAAGAKPPIGRVRTLAFSGAGNIVAPLLAVDLGMVPGARPERSTSGCEAADFAGFRPGAIALIRRGTCRFEVKVDNATAAGAAGVVILNEGVDGATGSFRGQLSEMAEIPVVGIDHATGGRLLAATEAGSVEVRLMVAARSGRHATHNVIAETRLGDPDRVILVGAHLDSVPDGPGINDNASGAAVILETALQLAKLRIAPGARIRFAFWGAEEAGLVGSRHYVDTLSSRELEKIAAVLNFDMLGSPNYGRFVYDADESDTASRRAPEGSTAIERIFLDYFDAVGLEAAPTRIDAGSDHAPFADKGIAVGGLYAGSGEKKSAAAAASFGGSTGRAYDACYHRACDRTESISRQAIDEMSDAAAHAVLTLAGRTAGS